jgi:hypothetical protein
LAIRRVSSQPENRFERATDRRHHCPCILRPWLPRRHCGGKIHQRRIQDFRALPNPDLIPERSTLIDIGRAPIGRRNPFCRNHRIYSYYKHLIEPTLASDLTHSSKTLPQPASWHRKSAALAHLERPADHRSFRHLDESTRTGIQTDPPLPTRVDRLLFAAFFLERLFCQADFRYMSRLERVAVYPLDERIAMRVWDFRLGYIGKTTDCSFSCKMP